MPNHGTTLRPEKLLKKPDYSSSLSQSVILILMETFLQLQHKHLYGFVGNYIAKIAYFFPGAVFHLDQYLDLVNHAATQIFMMAQYNR